MEDTTGKQEKEHGSLLDRLVEDAFQKFSKQESYTSQYGKTEPYSFLQAAADAMKDPELGKFEIATKIMQETTVRPRDVYMEFAEAEEEGPWEEYLYKLAELIVEEELERRHPEAKAEEEKRMERFE